MRARLSSVPSIFLLILFLSTWPVFNTCRNHQEQDSAETGKSRIAPSRLRGRESWIERRKEREQMVATQIQSRGIKDPRVLKAMRDVPRHFFVLESDQRSAYRDEPRGIGERQTISQPYIVAFMTEALDLKPDDRVLEIGTGSGYQAAILAELVEEVYTIEIIPSLGKKAKALLYDMGFDNVHARIGDGYKGWPEKAPFDAVIVTAAPDHVPPALIEQLKPGGRLVIPVGSFYQELKLIEKTPEGMKEKSILPVRFVPMTGEAEK